MTHPCDRCGKPCRPTSRYCGNKCRSRTTYERHKAANPRPALPRGRPRAVKFPPWVILYEQSDPWGDVTRYVFGQEKTEAEARRWRRSCGVRGGLGSWWSGGDNHGRRRHDGGGIDNPTTKGGRMMGERDTATDAKITWKQMVSLSPDDMPAIVSALAMRIRFLERVNAKLKSQITFEKLRAAVDGGADLAAAQNAAYWAAILLVREADELKEKVEQELQENVFLERKDETERLDREMKKLRERLAAGEARLAPKKHPH